MKIRRIYEYRIFDLLKDPENEKFLNKVKTENPDLYTRFLNLVANKGLDVAKEKYVQYDPDVVKARLEKEKKEKELQKKLGRKEYSKRVDQEALEFWSKEIEEIEEVISNSILKELDKKLMKNKNIESHLKNATKKYTNNFKLLLKKPQRIGWEIRTNVKTDSLTYSVYSFMENRLTNIINISQYYDQTEKKLFYSIQFHPPEKFLEDIPKFDYDKEPSFLISRNEHIKKMSNSNITKLELFDILFNRFANILDEDVYKNWKKEYDFSQTINKYNL